MDRRKEGRMDGRMERKKEEELDLSKTGRKNNE